MGNLLGSEILYKIPEYRYGKPKSSMREIKNIMREMEYDEESIENINDDFCEGFGVAREIMSDLLWEKVKGELDLDKNVNSENCTEKVILHKGRRVDNGEEITGFLTKMFGLYHIILEEDENTAYPVMEDSIQPCLEGSGLVEKPWNRWYVNENMLPRLQNTVLICKGWYNKEKYHSEYEALRAYWANIAEVSVEDIGYDAVLQCLLLPACEAFLCNRKFCEIFYEKVFKNEICGRKMKAYFDHTETDYRKMDAEYLIELFTGALFALRNDEFSFEKKPEDGYCVV